MSKNAQTKHCTICANAGFPSEVYSTHYIRESRDPNSRVTCPLLKNNICSKCKLKGHFANSCKVTIRKKPDVASAVSAVEKPKIKTKNVFDFGSESEDEEEVLPKQSEKDYSKRFTLECWQIENKHLLANPESERNTERYYWDSTYKVFCSKNFKIIEKRVMALTQVVTILVPEPKKSSWADSDDEE